ncbi:MAG: MATE family efflux transporter [Planctomycetota bacterium]
MSSSSPRDEVVSLLRLALPITAVQVGMMAMGVVDNLMVGRVSPEALAAANLGHAYSSAVSFALGGLLYALDPLVSQAFGAGDRTRLARHVERGLALALVISVPVMVLHALSGPVFRALEQDPRIIPGAVSYVERLGFSAPAFLLFTALRQSFQATDRTREIVVAIVLGNLLNVVANYGLVFGNFGLPALGVAGSAIATTICRWGMLLVILFAGRDHLAALRPPHPRPRLGPRPFAELLRLGGPITLQVSLELWVFVAVALLMGRQGATALAAHGVAINLASLSFMVPLGLGMAAAARVGQAIGAGDPGLARRRAAVALGVGAVVQLVFSAIFLVLPETLARAYTDEIATVAAAAALISIAGVFQLCDGLQAISAGILRGAADTRIPALLALFGYWLVGLPLGLVLAHRGSEVWLGGYWWGLCGGLATVALLLMRRIRRRLGRA